MTHPQESTPHSTWLCRHGNRMDFVDPSWKGKDAPLSPDGVVQARETGRRLRREGIRHVFASPFLRTVETAFHIAEALDLLIKVEHGACEWLNPAWFSEHPRLMSPEDLAGKFPRIDLSYPTFVRPRHPETREDCMARCHETAMRISAAYRENLLIVGHGASIVGLTQGFLGEDEEPEISGKFCALIKVAHRNGESALELNGDNSHLSGNQQDWERLH